jgi:hypothetical protein
MTIARSGSSMVTSIFAAHGFHTSRGHYAKLVDGAKYWTFEDSKLRDYYRGNRIVKPGDLINFHTFVNHEKLKRVISGLPEPWIIKTGVEKWPLFKDLPCVVVKVRRSAKHIARSMATKKGEAFDYVYPLIVGKQELFNEFSGHSVYSEDIIAGDFSSLGPVFDELGMALNLSKAQDCVNPDMWHYK